MSDLRRSVVFDSEARNVIKGALCSSISNTKVDASLINTFMGGFTKTVGTWEEAELAADAFLEKVERKLGKNSLMIGALADKNSEVHDFLKATLGYPHRFPFGRDAYTERFLECVASEAGEAANKKRKHR